MSKGNSPASITPAPTPTPPTPTSSTYYQDGVQKSSSIYNKKTNTYTNNSYSTPQEQQIQNNSNQFLANLPGQVQSAVNLTPQAMQQYRDAYAAPQINALNTSYNLAKGQALQGATSHGLQNSVGFGQYTANQLEKNRAQGLADIQSNAYTQGFDLPNKMLAPYVTEANLYNGLANGQQTQMAQTLAPSLSSTQVGNNANNQYFNNQLAAAQYQNKNSLYGLLTGGY